METGADKMLPCGDGDEDVLPNKRLLRWVQQGFVLGGTMPEGRPVDPANWGVVGFFYFGTDSVGFFR